MFSLAILAAIGLPVYIISVAFYRYALHPLSRYPGPTLWTITRIPYSLSLRDGSAIHKTHALHEKYGSVVRVAPNELSFITASAAQTIYTRQDGNPPFPKNRLFYQPAPNGTPPVSSANDEDHARMRKLLSHAFSARAIQEQEPLIQRYIDLLIQRLHERANGPGQHLVDMGRYFSYCVFDIFGDLGLGDAFNCLKDDHLHKWVSMMISFPKEAVITVSYLYFPILLPVIPFLMPRGLVQNARDHFAMCKEKIHRRLALGPQSYRKDIMSYILRNNNINNDKAEGMTVPEIEANGWILIFAGSETTASALSAAVNLLVRYPDKLAKLRKEVCRSSNTEAEITFSATEKQEYLNACLQESLRLAPPVAGQIPRIVPKGGHLVDGHFVPGGTHIGVPQWAAYRSSSHFALPDAFVPERWLDPASSLFAGSSSSFTESFPFAVQHEATAPYSPSTFVDDNRAVMQPFSIGPRNCVGMNLAWAEMRVILARLLWNFDLRAPTGGVRVKFEEQLAWLHWEREPCEVELVEMRL